MYKQDKDMNNMKHKILMTLVALFAMTTGAWAADYYVVGSFTDWNPKEAYKLTLNTACTTAKEYMLTVELPADAQFKVVQAEGISIQAWFPTGIGNNYGENGELPGAGWYTIYFRPDYNGNEDWFYNTIYVAASEAPEPAPEGPKVTINEAKTEASFEMPTYDMTVDYELVRDMSVSMTTKIGDGTDGYRIRLQKNEQTGKYEPAEMTVQQLIALVKVHDAIEDYDLTFGVLGANCIVNIYAANDENQATGDPITYQNLTPGRYIAKAVAATGSAYEGETAMSNIFVLYEGYEVVIPAGEYATFYKDEAVRVNEADKENFKLYTVSSVSGDKATLSDAVDAMPKNTPMLVYNSTNETKTVLLIPCDEPDLAITVADQFLGTLTDKTFIDADMAAADYYVCNGKQFVKVRGAGTLGANKAYLKFVTNQQQSAPQYISISGDLGEGTTRIDNLNVNDNENGEWYDLNGRKLNGKPAQKGIYIKNGKKVVVR